LSCGKTPSSLLLLMMSALRIRGAGTTHFH
jgi:hypothetical protein